MPYAFIAQLKEEKKKQQHLLKNNVPATLAATFSTLSALWATFRMCDTVGAWKLRRKTKFTVHVRERRIDSVDWMIMQATTVLPLYSNNSDPSKKLNSNKKMWCIHLLRLLGEAELLRTVSPATLIS